MFSASTAGSGGRLPPNIDSLIARYELSAGGQQIAQGFNDMNVFAHAKRAIAGDNCDKVLGHPEMVRAKSYVDGFGDSGTSGLTGTENESYPTTNNATQFCVGAWEGFLGSCEPGILDTGLLPDMVLTLYLADNSVLSTVAGIALDGTGSSDITDDGSGATFTIDNFHLNVETLGMADSVYENMLERRMAEGFLEIPYKSYFSFPDTHTGTTRWSVSTQSLDRVWVAFRASDYSTQGGAVRINGHKKTGAFVDDVAGQTAADIDIGMPDYDAGGVMGIADEKYTSKYFNFAEDPASGANPSYQLQLNNAMLPQFKASAEDWWCISKNSIPHSIYEPKAKTLDQYKNNYFVMCARLNLPDSEAGREISGLDTRGINLNGSLQSTGVDASSAPNLVIFAECTSTLRVGAGRAVEVIQ
tara:strand:+ start:2298 stop:3542 length:1245 start_codon:yes stop_codon:yes gene_type:complete